MHSTVMMKSKTDFATAWKARFPSIKTPELDCFQVSNLVNGTTNLDLVGEEKLKYEEAIQSLKNELYQKEFIAGYLWELLHQRLENDNVAQEKDKCSKKPVTAPKLSSSGNASVISNVGMHIEQRADPDLDLDCQVPVVDDQRLSHQKTISPVPAYMETDLDYDIRCDSNSSVVSDVSDPGYLPPRTLNRPPVSDDEKLFMINDGNECKTSNRSDLIDSVLKNEKNQLPTCGVGILDSNDSENDSNTLWTKGVDFEKLKPSVNIGGAPQQSRFTGKDGVFIDQRSDPEKNKLTRVQSADTSQPSSYASHRREMFEKQRKSCSFGGAVVEVNSKIQVSSSPPAGTGTTSFSTFKPQSYNTPVITRDSDKKSKPVPVPRVSIGTPEFKVKDKPQSTMFATSGNDGVNETETKSLDLSEMPAGMCRIMPPSAVLRNVAADGQTTMSLPTNIQVKSGSVLSGADGVKPKKEKPQRPKKPSIKSQDYMNFEVGMIKPPRQQAPPATIEPPVMVVKSITGAQKSPLLSRSISETVAPSRVAPPPPVVQRPTTMNLDVVIAKPKDSKPQGEVIYEEPIPVQRDRVEEVSSSDEDEPVYQNLFLLKHQMSGKTQSGSSMFTSMDYQKRHLHKKAERLSRRYSSLDMSSTSTTGGALSRYVGTDQLKSIGEREQDEPDTGRGGSTLPSDGGSDSWRKRQSMLFATGDDNTSEDDLDVVVPTCAETEKIHMRKYVVPSIVASERMYLLTLDTLMQYMQTFKNVQNTPQSVLASEDIEVIFCKIPELHRMHFNFINNMEPKLENWTGEEEIAENFKILALEECQLATEYLKNYQNAISVLHRCTTDSVQFAELTQSIKCKGSTEAYSLEELLHKPVVRFQRNTLVLHDLIKFTPTSHPDYDTLQKTKKIAQNFLENFQSPVDKSNAENQRYLSKQGLVVEKVGSGSQRKLRQIFLFNDVLVCAKQKLSRQKIIHELKWAIPLTDLEFIDDRLIAQEERLLIEDTKQETDKLQRRVSELQNELKQEMKKAKLASDGQVSSWQRSWSFRGHKGNLEKIKKKLYEQESQLMLAAPHLILKLRHQRTDKCYSLLLASDYERIGWKETVTGLQSKYLVPRTLSLGDLANLVSTLKLPKLNSSGSIDINDFELEEEALFGSLDATVHKLCGLLTPCDVYCSMEVDTFGHFCLKAKTNLIRGSTEPSWNENFDIELDGAQQLRVLVYKMSAGEETLIGKCALELGKGWLRGDFTEEAISIGDSRTLVLTLKYRNREQTIKRTPSSVQGGLFGVRIATVAKREGTKIPLIVSTCVQEVERRGMDDVGIYRISGLNAEIQKLKRTFEKCKNPTTASMIVKEVDINVIAGVLKLYFRELPESLFTDKLYYRFQEGIMLSDPEAKEKFMMTIFKSLPEPNLSTAVFMLDHLVRVTKHELKNKMSIHNLSTVFGPTLLRPATKESEPLSMEQLFTAGAQDALMQTGILYFYLSSWHNKDTPPPLHTRL